MTRGLFFPCVTRAESLECDGSKGRILCRNRVPSPEVTAIAREAKKTNPAKLSFNEAVTEVEEILENLESDAVDIDTLGVEVKRAVELLQVCRAKLEKTDKEVRDLVAGLDPAEGTPASSAAAAPSAGDDNAEDLPF